MLREMLDDMRARKLSVLVLRHTDRIDRTEDLGEIIRDVKAAGGQIESIDEPWLGEVSGLSGKLMTAVTEWTNAEYVRMLAANVRDAQAARRAVGSWAAGRSPTATGSWASTLRVPARGARQVRVLLPRARRPQDPGALRARGRGCRPDVRPRSPGQDLH